MVSGAAAAAAAAVSAAPAHAVPAADRAGDRAADRSRAASGAPGRSGQVPGPDPTRYDERGKRANPANQLGCPLGKGA